MILLAFGVLGGAVAVHRFALLPDWPWAALLVPSLALLFWARLQLPAGLLLGAVLAAIHGQAWLDRAVPWEMAGAEVTVSGQIHGLPDHSRERSRFVLRIDRVHAGPQEFRAQRLRVTQFPAEPELRAGDRLSVTLRIRPPRGLHNPSGFDYGTWLYREGIHGLASVRGGVIHEGRAHTALVSSTLHRARETVRDAMQAAYPGARHPGVMQALVIGERGAMEDDEWRLFLHTGTNHLMAISGLHVGLVAGFAVLIARVLWRRLAGLWRRVSMGLFTAVAAVVAASMYAGLAGFSIPTQRALIMLLMVTAAIVAGRDPLSWRVYAAALLVVIAIHPPNVLAPGFWFSFGAVAVILLLVQGRVGRPGLSGWLGLQVLLALALLPLSLAWFQLGAWIAPAANLIAVPVVGLLVLPTLLAGAGLALVSPALGSPLLWWADGCLFLLLQVLEWMLRVPGAVSQTGVRAFAAVLAGAGVVLLLLPRLRVLAPWILLAWLPLVLPPAPRLDEGVFRAELLDVGQGLAVIVQTRRHVVLYDAGPAWEGGFDSGESIVLPALRRLGVRRVDRILVSHEHRDHRGGVAAVVEAMPVGKVLSRRPDLHEGEEACEAGLAWEWDGVQFQTLHPPAFWDDGNAASCVLSVRGPGGRLLLTGDLEGLGESVLVRAEREALATDLLLVPHHGARGVLGRGLLEAAAPRAAWVSRGFDNRFEHPSPDVTERLRQGCVPLLDSAERGMLWLEAGPDGIRLSPGSRAERPRFWQPPVPPLQLLPDHCPDPGDRLRR
ncbi:putative hydrolase of the metallo-beta-lactamase superfamily, clustered with KDO2-Lipid A biosynthesis genes [Thioalkalivibrio nitratireducens DSM 14787]|uniref:Hydrolase of the metallo-beta-lactamase superfamily, clustered with KDO2-Lipid A biosynthesis genes n=1 Tax=Thioalkalivibrio nitratireducens (strain DSM 14787 / UNIQEM 213 / ALEN2) TaxID=1255043 RepID=L0DWU8_THIND|nr:DNA internalization-related competence protein ComEC/Rec2 [Thioalkalivibrio nitratireducens]AGA33477.1 putative hydrolase of the metallo-beta-lactamase superfamily, clustered with KDO2-Lipid A biosynthesis genes [Thioalkalivibrio nitratireducens DSM 14787]